MKKLKLKKKNNSVKRIRSVRRGGGIADHAPDGVAESKLKLFDIPIGQLVPDEHNPNRQSEDVFDELVERVREEGFDEPIIVYPEMVSGKPTGKYKIASGHHRVKAMELIGGATVPAVIREGWDDDRALIELTARNSLRGDIDPKTFTDNYNRLAKKYGEEQLRKMMGLTGKKQFDALYQGVKKQLPARQQKKLEEAKEEIHSVEDLSQVLNEIFREHGTKLDKSLLVFSFGGKEHTYIQVDKTTYKAVASLAEKCGEGEVEAGSVFMHMLRKLDTDTMIREVKNG